MCVCFYANTMQFYYYSSGVQLESRSEMSPAVLLSIGIVLASLRFGFGFGFFEAEIDLSSSVMNSVELMRIALSL